MEKVKRAIGELDRAVNCGLYADVDVVSHIKVRRLNWIGLDTSIGWMPPENSIKFSAVNLREKEK